MSLSSLLNAPRLALAAPLSGVTFANKRSADIPSACVDTRKRAAKAILPVAPQGNCPRIEQVAQPSPRPARSLALGPAAPVHLRRVDAFDTDLLAVQPEGIAVDDAGNTPTLAAHAERTARRSRRLEYRQRRNHHGERQSSHQSPDSSTIIHLGTFEGENKRRAAAHAGSLAQDLAGLAAMLAFCASLALVVALTASPWAAP